MNGGELTYQIRFKIVYEINSFGGCISSVNQFTSLSKQIGQIRLLIDARDFSATGCDRIGCPIPLLDHDSTLNTVGQGCKKPGVVPHYQFP